MFLILLEEIKAKTKTQTASDGLGVYYPKGKGTQRTGVAIDFQTKPKVQSTTNGEDLQLQKAIEFINK